MSAELAARKKEIEDKAASHRQGGPLHQITRCRRAIRRPSEIQKAFFGLAKKWHPDRVPPTLADVKNLCAKVFGRMSEAHQTLMDPAKRAKYESSRKAGRRRFARGAGAGRAILGAATNFQKAEICLKRNDTRQAEEFCKKALDVDPKQADYIAMMAWLDSQKPQKQDPGSTQQQILELTRRIGTSQAQPRGRFYPERCCVEAALAEEPQNEGLRRSAVELNPRNADATSASFECFNSVRAPRDASPASLKDGKKDAKKEEGGIFGRLFKK